MLMSYNQHPTQQQPAPVYAPPATLTTADMQRLREAYASRVAAASSATQPGEILYPLPGGPYASYEYVSQQPAAAMVQGSMLYGAHNNHPSHQHRMPVYTSVPVTSNSLSLTAAHPMIQERYNAGSWPPIERYGIVAPQSQNQQLRYQQQVPRQSEAPVTTTTPGGLPELRAEFHGDGMSKAMFNTSAIDDELNDAKLLREVLQDNHHPCQQYPYQYQHPDYRNARSYPDPMSLTALFSECPALTVTTSPSASSFVSSSSYASSPVSSLSSSGFGSSSSASASASASASTSELMLKRKPASRICRMPGCSKGIRSRGLCKGHGGGRRCLTPGCEISDQGGGHCIAHGGGKRCTVVGCQKSAQSKGLCKLHGGARRCKVPDCAKNCQVKGLCRLHYSMFAASATSPSASLPSRFVLSFAMDIIAHS